MEATTLNPTYNRIKWSGRDEEFSNKSNNIINTVNFILELIIKNTIQYNKFTLTDEIYERIINISNETKQVIDTDIYMIENICEALSANNGILIKLTKNKLNYYKLNHIDYV